MKASNGSKQLERRLLIIQNEIIRLRIHRHIFKEVWEIFASNQELNVSNYFFDWMWRSYADSLSMYVRRLTDDTKRVVSLSKLLEELKSSPTLMNRESFMERFATIDGRRVTIFVQKFNEYVGDHGSCLTKAQIELDRQLLKKSSEKLKRHIDRRVAHYKTDDAVETLPNTNDVEYCLDIIESLFQKYYFLLTGTIANPIDPPSILIHDWKEIFTFPWVEADSANRK